MRRLYIAMRPSNLQGDFLPRNRKLYEHAGIARNYSMEEHTIKCDRSVDRRGWRREKLDNGHVLIVDLDSLPRVKFTDRGKPIGLGVDGIPSKLDEYENAERMLEIWAKRAAELRAELNLGTL